MIRKNEWKYWLYIQNTKNIQHASHVRKKNDNAGNRLTTCILIIIFMIVYCSVNS